MTKKNFLLGLVSILLVTAILAIINWNINREWKSTPWGIWWLLGSSMGYATGFVVAIVTIVSLLNGLSKGQSEKGIEEFTHQLPEIDKFFTGREERLNELEKQLLESEKNVCGIHGASGIGKTTFAIAFAKRFSQKHDAELYIDMRGTSDNSASSEDAMLHVIKSFNPTYSNLENKSLITGAYRSILKGRKAIILLDNIDSEAQLTDLFPPTESMLLFTTRKRFTTPKSIHVDLPILAKTDASAFLLRIANRLTSEEAGRIAELCGYVPNALVKAAYAVKEFESLEVKRYISELSTAERRLGLVEASISTTYNLLTSELKAAWRFLSVFPDDFGIEASTIVLGYDAEHTDKILHELIRLSLINIQVAIPSVPNDFDIAEYRFKFHDLDRLFASSNLKTDERKKCEMRFVEYYGRVLTVIYAYFRKGGTDFLVALSAFDREWVNIEHAQKLALKYSKTNERAAQLCLVISLNSAEIIDNRLPKNIIIEWSESALRVARRMKDLGNEGITLAHLGTAYSDIGEMDRGIPLLLRAAEIAISLNNRESEMSAFINLGNAYRRKGDLDKGLDYHLKAYQIAKEIKGQDSESVILVNIGNVYHDKKDLKNALYYHQIGLDKAIQKGNSVEEANALVLLASDYLATGKIIAALKSNWSALKLARKIKAKGIEAEALGLFRSVFRAFGLGVIARVKYFRES